MKYKSNEERQAENHRKMFLAMAQDIRVILIKLADRLHNMRTLKYLPEEKQRRIANETLEIFAPRAPAGNFQIKWELEDIALRYPQSPALLSDREPDAEKRAEREQYLQDIIRACCGNGWRKRASRRRFRDGRNTFTASTARWSPSTSSSTKSTICWPSASLSTTFGTATPSLGIIHTIWKPMPGRFKDYIAMPKPNMYQSLHTTVIGPSGEPIEVQIRTWEMHKTAEYGIAAHWAYKEGTQVQPGTFEEKLKWFREILEMQQETQDAQEFVENLKIDLFSDSVFVFTPKGDVVELPAGSVPLDFAYRIHTEVGNQCIGAKVNGKIVPLDYKLKTGDIVEILTSKHSYGPSQDWLKMVKSSHARNKIRNWFKKQRREESVAKGREMIENLLRKYDFNASEVLTDERVEEVARKFNFSNEEDMYAAVGYGGLSAAQVVHRLIEGLRPEAEQPVLLPEVKELPRRSSRRQAHGVRVKGLDNLLVRLSRCCNPVPGDEIAGFVTRGRGVSVHRKDCPNLKSVEKERMIPVEWEGTPDQSYHVDIEVSGLDRRGLLHEVLQAVSETKTNLSAVSGKADRRGMASIHMTISIRNLNHLQHVVERIKRVRDIYSVRRIMQ